MLVEHGDLGNESVHEEIVNLPILELRFRNIEAILLERLQTRNQMMLQHIHRVSRNSRDGTPVYLLSGRLAQSRPLSSIWILFNDGNYSTWCSASQNKSTKNTTTVYLTLTATCCCSCLKIIKIILFIKSSARKCS